MTIFLTYVTEVNISVMCVYCYMYFPSVFTREVSLMSSG
jgi:hypothetical protein